MLKKNIVVIYRKVAIDIDNTYSVYIHENKINHKKYIGITCQKPEHRWKAEGKGYEECPYFWNAIQKYGWDNFEHTVLFAGLSAQEANDKEIELIAAYKTYDNAYGYNISKGGFGVNTETMREAWANPEFKDFMSQRMREAWQDPDKRKRRSERATERWQNETFKDAVTQKIKEVCGTSVICVETGKVWNNICDIERELGLNHSNICRALRTGYRCGGYHWKYNDNVF